MYAMKLRGVLLLFSCVVVVLVAAALWWSSPDRAERRRARTHAEPGRESVLAESRADVAGPLPRGAEAEPVATVAGLTFSGSLELAGELNELNGRVVWEDGSPVAYALVYLASSPFDDMTRWVLGKQGRVVCSTSCDVDGWFLARWAPGSLFSLTAMSPDGHARTLREPPGGGEITVVLSKRPTVLEVEVVDEATGKPVPDAFVGVDYLDWDRTSADFTGRTGKDGRLRWDRALEGRAFLSVTPIAGERVLNHSVVCRPGEITRTRIAIGRGLTVRGRVVSDESGAGIAGATVMLGFRYFRHRIQTRTDANGNFVLERLPWGPRVRRTLQVVAAGFASWQCQVGHPERDGAEQEVNPRLLRGATIRLRCVRPDGTPRAGVLVVAESERLIPEERVVASDFAKYVTGEDGRALLEGLPPGDAGSVTCWVGGSIALERPLAALKASETRDLGDLVVPEVMWLEGTVRTAEGDPATGAFAVLEPHHAEDEEFDALASALIGPRLGARIDGRGRFRIRGVRPGTWDLLIHGGGHPRLLRVAIPIRRGKQPKDLDLRLPTAVTLRGRVVDRNGVGIAGLEIEFLRSHPVGFNLAETVKTGADGRFEIPGFTREDEQVPVRVREREYSVTPRDGPIEISLDR